MALLLKQICGSIRHCKLHIVFFVLRKKQTQVTFLHVFHHGLMTYIVFLGFNLNGFGFHILIALAWNTTIHAIMYFYYAIAALGPEIFMVEKIFNCDTNNAVPNNTILYVVYLCNRM